MSCDLKFISNYINRGITPKYTDSIEDSYFVINQKCIRNFNIDLNLSRRHNHISKKVPEDKILQKYDVLINSTGTGTLGRVAQYLGDQKNITIDSHVTIVRPCPKKVDPLFFGYLLRSQQRNIELLAEGSTGQTELPKKSLSLLKLNFIQEQQEQREIAHFLLSLDQKIELNNQINQTLEDMAQALFKSWFIDFDPVKAKMRGEQPVGMDAETAALFPDKLVDSELGLIPEGWEISISSDISKVSIGKTPPRKEKEWFNTKICPSNIKWVSIKDMGKANVYLSDTSEYLTHDAIKKFNVKIVPKNTVILSFKLTIGRVAITEDVLVTNEAIAHFDLSNESSIASAYLYLYLKSFNFDMLGSTSSIATAVNSKVIKKIPIIIPPNDLHTHFDNSISKIFHLLKSMNKQNQTLSQLRDTLLPKLLSGEISLDAAQTQVEQGLRQHEK